MKIVCIGRNYVEHIKELGNEKPDAPLVFTKSDNAWLNNKNELYLPSFSENIHYEAELVIKIDKAGKHIKKQFAHKYYSSLSIGLDLTARDIQEKCKEKGLPWELAKSWDGAAPVGAFIPVEENAIDSLNFELFKNEVSVQKGDPQKMLYSVDEFIEYVSQYITLKKGDLIFTGTPAGVGKVAIGDHYKGYVNGKLLLDLKIK
ncbi:MAG: fumarylacetoacetate hydrolase family protein [Flavobacteriales bacterium]|jgi:2-keto-4-pentenoate hydratase/2-oxohepta-3-ene-1,7-dioic acid hydratase in catechol pathway|nr:fumarylacetoacetate hydrolase family protein [Flavobacteriales bacterium]